MVIHVGPLQLTKVVKDFLLFDPPRDTVGGTWAGLIIVVLQLRKLWLGLVCPQPHN